MSAIESSDDKGGVSAVIRSSLWLYLGSMVNNLVGFVFWVLLYAIAGAKDIGTASAVISLAYLVSSAVSLGAGVGMSKWLGHCVSRNDKLCEATYFWSAFTYVLLANSLSATILLLISVIGMPLLNYGPSQLLIASYLILALSADVFMNYFIGIMVTRPYFAAVAASNAAKLAIGLTLVMFGFGWVGIVFAFIIQSAVFGVIGIIYVMRRAGLHGILNIRSLPDVLKAGIPSWLPNMVTVLGRQLAVIAVYSVWSPEETGHLYIALTIANFVTGFSTSLQSIMLPYLSGLNGTKESALWESLRVGLAFVGPTALAIAGAAREVLSFIKPEYGDAWAALTLALIANLLMVLVMSVMNLSYSFNRFLDVLGIGLSASLTRIALYILLTPVMGSTGAAFSYLVGAAVGLAHSALLAHGRSYSIPWLSVLGILGVSSLSGFLCWLLTKQVSGLWLLWITISVAVGYTLLWVIGYIKREDVSVLIKELLPKSLKSLIIAGD